MGKTQPDLEGKNAIKRIVAKRKYHS